MALRLCPVVSRPLPGWHWACSKHACSSHPAEAPWPRKRPELPSSTRQGWGGNTPRPPARLSPGRPVPPGGPLFQGKAAHPSGGHLLSKRVKALGAHNALLLRYRLPLSFGENSRGLDMARTPLLETSETADRSNKQTQRMCKSTATERVLSLPAPDFAHEPTSPSLIKGMWAKAWAPWFCGTEGLLVPHFLDAKESCVFYYAAWSLFQDLLLP